LPIALIELTDITRDSPDEINACIDTNVKDPQLNRLLKGMAARTPGDIKKIRDEPDGTLLNESYR
jgi:hypothetical protein